MDSSLNYQSKQIKANTRTLLKISNQFKANHYTLLKCQIKSIQILQVRIKCQISSNQLITWQFYVKSNQIKPRFALICFEKEDIKANLTYYQLGWAARRSYISTLLVLMGPNVETISCFNHYNVQYFKDMLINCQELRQNRCLQGIRGYFKSTVKYLKFTLNIKSNQFKSLTFTKISRQIKSNQPV